MTQTLLPTEYDECVALVAYLEILKTQKRIVLFTHIPNETFTKSWGIKMKNKRMGVRSGFPDYIILTPKKTLCLEMKRKKGGVVSKEQTDWISGLIDTGVESNICYGFDEAKDWLALYI